MPWTIRVIAELVSLVFHPLFIPIYVIAFFFYMCIRCCLRVMTDLMKHEAYGDDICEPHFVAGRYWFFSAGV